MLQLPMFLELSIQQFPPNFVSCRCSGRVSGVDLRIDISGKFPALPVLQNTPCGKVPIDFD